MALMTGRTDRARQITFSIPEKVGDRIDSLADENGWNRSQTILQLVSAGLMVLGALAAASQPSQALRNKEKVARASSALLEGAAQQVKRQSVRKAKKVKD